MSVRGSMLTVIKLVLTAGVWVSEPRLVAMLQSRGISNARSDDFATFFRQNPGLLDRMMAGAGCDEKGFDLILVNRSQCAGIPTTCCGNRRKC